jgi:hypothetical protein
MVWLSDDGAKLVREGEGVERAAREGAFASAGVAKFPGKS